MTHSIANHHALITGAGRGIGRASAIKLAEEGVNLALLARSKNELEDVAHECSEHNVNVIVLPCDVRDDIAVSQAIKQCMAEFPSLEILFNNHGVGRFGLFKDTPLENWQNVIDINLKATMLISQLTLPYITQSTLPNRALIYLASISSKLSSRGGNSYCASKHGMLGFANCLFEEIREENIKVTSICPGYVNTSMVNTKPELDPEKMIQPDDIAQLIINILQLPLTVCPTEIILRPQQSPYIT